MSLVKTVTGGLIHKEGEFGGGWLPCHGWWKHGDYWFSCWLMTLPKYLKYLPIWILSLLGFRWAMIVFGTILGYSHCYHCLMPWKYVEHRSINFSKSQGMFPLCVHCFDKLEPDQINPYIEKLVMKWQEINIEYNLKWDNQQTPVEVIVAAKAEVRRMKGIVE